jgi:hypothetical protein
MRGGRWLRRNWASLLWALVAFGIVGFAFIQFTAGIVAMGVFVVVLSQLVRSLESKSDLVSRIREQIDKLYGPHLQRAKFTLAAVPGNAMPFVFAQEMDDALGGSLRHLAADATLAAYDSTKDRAANADAWARNLAAVFLADHAKLVERFRKVVPA